MQVGTSMELFADLCRYPQFLLVSGKGSCPNFFMLSMIISAQEAAQHFKRGGEKLLEKKEKLFVVVGLEEWTQAQRRRRPSQDSRHEQEQGSGLNQRPI